MNLGNFFMPYRSVNINNSANTTMTRLLYLPQSVKELNRTSISYKSKNKILNLLKTKLNDVKNNNSLSHLKKFNHSQNNIKQNSIPDLDIDKIISLNDLSKIEDHLEELVYSSYNNENDQMVKLISIFQNSAVYLIQIQNDIEKQNFQIEETYKNLHKEAYIIDEELKNNREVIHNFKKLSKDLKSKLNLYKNVTQERKNLSMIASSSRIETIKSSNICNSNYFCEFCTGKNFSSMDKLQHHYNRKHAAAVEKNLSPTIESNLQSINSKESIETLMENKITKLKEDLTFSITNVQNENLKQIIENNLMLEKNIVSEILNIRSNQTDALYIKETKDLFEEIKKNNRTYIDGVSHTNIDNFSFERTLNQFELETKKLNNCIDEMNKNNNNKYSEINKELNKFKDSIVKDLKEVTVKVDELKSNWKVNSSSLHLSHCHITDIEILPIKIQSIPPMDLEIEKEPLKNKKTEKIEHEVDEKSILLNESNIPHITEIEKDNMNESNLKPPSEALKSIDYRKILKNCFENFIKRDQSFIEIKEINKDGNNLNYKIIDEFALEKSIDSDHEINSFLNKCLSEALNDSKLLFSNIDTEDCKTISQIIQKISDKSFSYINKDDYFSEYIKNIYKILEIKKYLSDEKIINKSKRDEIFSNSYSKSQDTSMEKKKLEKLETAKFNQNKDIHDF